MVVADLKLVTAGVAGWLQSECTAMVHAASWLAEWSRDQQTELLLKTFHSLLLLDELAAGSPYFSYLLLWPPRAVI